MHETQRKNLSLQTGRKYRTSLEICESQANFCAACFLMPKELVSTLYNRMKCMPEDRMVQTMAGEFSVSKTAMRIRLQSLSLNC